MDTRIRHGIIIPDAHDALQRKAKRDLTQWIIIGRPGQQRKIPVRLYTVEPGVGVRVPSAWFHQQHVPVHGSVAFDARSFNFTGTLRPEQETNVSKTADMLHTDGSATLVMQTGGGKTVCALAIASKIGARTLVLVHKSFLLEQWISRISQFMPQATVTKISGKVRDSSGDIVLGMFQTFVSSGLSIDPSFGLVIVDEAHHVAAETFTNVMLRGSQRYTLGLSATPKRKDGLDISPLTGDIVDIGQNVSTRSFDPSRITIEIHKYTCDAFISQPILTKRGDVNYSAMVTQLANISERTDFICSLVQKQQKPTIVLTHRRNHVVDICTRAKDMGVDINTFLPGTKDVPSNMVIVSTYQYASEGFDRHDLECLIMATPIQSSEQAIGRICRSMHLDSHHPVVIDIQDQWGVFISGGAKRRREYRTAGYTIFVKSGTPKKKQGSLFIDES